MTVERAWYVRVADPDAKRIVDLDDRAIAALRRSEKLPPGDRSEAIRLEALHAAIDQLAIAALASGAAHIAVDLEPGSEVSTNYSAASGTSVLRGGATLSAAVPNEVANWLAKGAIVVDLNLPHSAGPTPNDGDIGRGPPPPATRWQSTTTAPTEAIRERFEHLIAEALSDAGREVAAILPSGVSNTVLTETLRRYAARESQGRRVDLPVRYRDGSVAAAFPLRALQMSDAIPAGWRALRFTLMSIRHVEMDHVVDGAWLRNSVVSRPRAMAFTDAVVFDASMRQLSEVAAEAPTVLHMYQTGLEPAIVGFYRAVIHHLLLYPKTLVVVPQFFVNDGEFRPGTAWATN